MTPLEQLTALCEFEGRRTLRVTLRSTGEAWVCHVRTLTADERDALDFAVAASARPRAELVARALAVGEGSRAPLLPAGSTDLVGSWPGWIVDQLFEAALGLNRLEGLVDGPALRLPAETDEVDQGEQGAVGSRQVDREAVARKVHGIMGTLTKIRAFERVDPSQAASSGG
jgi:hypothetical protein